MFPDAASSFCSVHCSKAGIRAETFLHIASAQFLCRLQEKVVFDDLQAIRVGRKDWTSFQKLSNCSEALGEAIKELTGAVKRGKKA